MEALFSVRFAFWGNFVLFFSCVYLCVWLSSRSSSQKKRTFVNRAVIIAAVFFSIQHFTVFPFFTDTAKVK